MKEHVVRGASPGTDQGSNPSSSGDLRDTLLEVIHSTLFTSGVLEKYITRAVNDKIQNEVLQLVQREIQATLSSENIKILIDDKFRSISLYLKSEVIPKTVAQILKGQKQQQPA
jgi:hypothetical protein